MPISSDPEAAGASGCSLEAFPTKPVSASAEVFYSFASESCQHRSFAWQLVQILEQAFAVILGLCLLPLLAVVALIVGLASGRAPFVAHRRIGLAGDEIWVLKVRTMWDSPRTLAWPNSWLEYLPNTPVPEAKSANDPRVTNRFAAICRRFSIDEIPQIWQVARGTLALIGPRPLTATELDKFYGDAAKVILQVKPGITGLWQVRGRDRLTYKQRRRLDLFMLQNWSFRMYCRILFASIPTVLSGRGAY